MELEEFISGYCRTANRSNSVCCEYSEDGGKRVLEFMDCGYKNCLHTADCEIYKEAHQPDLCRRRADDRGNCQEILDNSNNEN